MFVYMLFGLGFTMVFPFAFRRLLDTAIPSGEFSQVLSILTVLGVAFVVSLLAGLRRAYLSAYVSGSVVRQLRMEMFGKLQTMSSDGSAVTSRATCCHAFSPTWRCSSRGCRRRARGRIPDAVADRVGGRAADAERGARGHRPPRRAGDRARLPGDVRGRAEARHRGAGGNGFGALDLGGELLGAVGREGVRARGPRASTIRASVGAAVQVPSAYAAVRGAVRAVGEHDRHVSPAVRARTRRVADPAPAISPWAGS